MGLDYFEKNGMYLPNASLIKTDYQNPDTDGDGLKDGEEIDMDIEAMRCRGGVKYYFLYSSYPDMVDSDGNGIMDCLNNNLDKTGYYTDSDDTAPLSKGLEGGIIGELTIISCSNRPVGHGFLIYRSYINDELDFGEFAGGYLFDEWVLINTSQESSYKYKIAPYEYVSIGNAGTHAEGGSGSSGSSGGGGSENIGDLNDGDYGGIYFNREFAYDFLKYSKSEKPENYTSGYSQNYSYTQRITETGLEKIFEISRNNNYYALTSNNCTQVAILSWNSVFLDEKFDDHTFPNGLKTEIKKREGSRQFDILSEVFGIEIGE